MHGPKTYFFDLMQAVNGSLYIKIARSDKQPDETYSKQDVVFFEEDFGFMLSALRDVFAAAELQLRAPERITRVGYRAGRDLSAKIRNRKRYLSNTQAK